MTDLIFFNTCRKLSACPWKRIHDRPCHLSRANSCPGSVVVLPHSNEAKYYEWYYNNVLRRKEGYFFLINNFLCFVSVVTLTRSGKIPQAIGSMIILGNEDGWGIIGILLTASVGSTFPVWAHNVVHSSKFNSKAKRGDRSDYFGHSTQKDKSTRGTKWSINICISEAVSSEKERIMPLCSIVFLTESKAAEAEAAGWCLNPCSTYRRAHDPLCLSRSKMWEKHARGVLKCVQHMHTPCLQLPWLLHVHTCMKMCAYARM